MGEGLYEAPAESSQHMAAEDDKALIAEPAEESQAHVEDQQETPVTTAPAAVESQEAGKDSAAPASEDAPDVTTAPVGETDPLEPAAVAPEADEPLAAPEPETTSEGPVAADSLASGELAPGEGEGATLPEDHTVYSVRVGGSQNVVSSDTNNPKVQRQTSTLADFWQLEAVGEQRYQLVSAKDGSHLCYDENGVVGSVGKGIWLILERLNDTLSLTPEDWQDLRLTASGTEAGSALSLSEATGSELQQFVFTKMATLSEALQKGAEVRGGTYAITSGVGNSQTLDIKGGSKANKGNVQIYTTNNSDAQRFEIESVGGGLYTLRSYHSDLYLEAAGGGTSKGTNVHQYRGNGTLSQLWYLTKSGSSYVLHNAKSGLVLDVAKGKATKGTNVQLYTANGSKAQSFALVADRQLEEAAAAGKALVEGIYALKAGVGSNLVLDVTGGSTAKGANIQVYTFADAFAQKAELTYVGKGRYTIQFANSGKYLDIKGGSKSSGANVQQWSGNGSRAQQWYFVRNADGSFTVKSALSGMALDVAGSAKKANVRVATPTGAAAQAFTLNAVPLLKDGTYVFSSVLSPAQLFEVAGSSSKKGANVQINRMARSNGQQLQLAYQGNHAYTLTNKASGLVLEVAGGSTAKGANVRQWSSNGTPAQQWILGVTDSGALTLRNAKSGLYLDLKGGKSARGTNVQQWSGNGSKAQSFVPYADTSSFVTKGKTGYQNPSRYYQISAYNCVLPSYANGFYTYVSPSVISPTATRSECVEAFIAHAMKYLGTGYVWDWSMAPGQGVDCSGLVMQCLYAVGMQTPYNTYDHMYDPWQDHNAENMHADNKFKKIDFSQRMRGDLIFYSGHVAIYLGNDLIINATPPRVQIQSVYSWAVTGCSRVFV